MRRIKCASEDTQRPGKTYLKNPQLNGKNVGNLGRNQSSDPCYGAKNKKELLQLKISNDPAAINKLNS